MIGLVLVVLIILILLVLNIKSQLLDKINEMSIKMDNLKKQLNQLNLQSEKKSESFTEKSKATDPTSVPEVKKEEIKPVIIKENIIPPVIKDDWVLKNVLPFETFNDNKAKDPGSPKEEKIKSPIVKPPQPSFFERNPDLENFIGENLINKIGKAFIENQISEKDELYLYNMLNLKKYLGKNVILDESKGNYLFISKALE